MINTSHRWETSHAPLNHANSPLKHIILTCWLIYHDTENVWSYSDLLIDLSWYWKCLIIFWPVDWSIMILKMFDHILTCWLIYHNTEDVWSYSDLLIDLSWYWRCLIIFWPVDWSIMILKMFDHIRSCDQHFPTSSLRYTFILFIPTFLHDILTLKQGHLFFGRNH